MSRSDVIGRASGWKVEPMEDARGGIVGWRWSCYDGGNVAHGSGLRTKRSAKQAAQRELELLKRYRAKVTD